MTCMPLSSPPVCCSARQPRELACTQSCGGEGGDTSHPEEAQSSAWVSVAQAPFSAPAGLVLASEQFVSHALITLMHQAQQSIALACFEPLA